MAAWQSPLGRVETLLLLLEAQIDVLGRLTPLGFSEQVRLAQVDPGFRPHFVYRPAEAMDDVGRRLEGAARALESFGSERTARVLRARVDELEYERQLVEARGASTLGSLSELRYPSVAQFNELAAARASSWLAEPFGDEAGAVELVDLASAAKAHRLVTTHRVPVFEQEMAALCAVSSDAVLVRSGAKVSEREVERVIVHEVLAHWLPRQEARRHGPPLRIGPAGCSVDEEGRALLLEARFGLLHGERRRELAARHLASQWALEGADYFEVCHRLEAAGVTRGTAVRSALRALRGGDGVRGGLARERIYLIGEARVGQAFAADPELERWFEMGRMSVAGARELGRPS